MGNSLHFILPVLLILGGFFGLVLADLPKPKVLAWGLFQIGWLAALLQLEPRGGAMVSATGGVLVLVVLGIFAVLWILGRQAPTPEDPKPASRKASR